MFVQFTYIKQFCLIFFCESFPENIEKNIFTLKYWPKLFLVLICRSFGGCQMVIFGWLALPTLKDFNVKELLTHGAKITKYSTWMKLALPNIPRKYFLKRKVLLH